MPATTLDTRGLNCPLPVLKARKALSRLGPGDRLRVLATDPRAPADFAAFCAERGHRLVESRESGGEFELLIEHGQA
jgi:tRNA 2-thiouridine synthesizing protein A